jgi:hypothetical protein
MSETSKLQRKIAELRGYVSPDAWMLAPDYTTDLTAAYPLFLDLLAAHCDPALVAGWEPGTVECTTVTPKLSNRAPKEQPALAIALTWCEWKEGLKNE